MPAKGLKILVVGAGCAGPAFALMLQRSDPRHLITVIERFSSLRTGGQQLDLKAEGLTITNYLGLMDELKAICVKETGVTVVDRKGNSLIEFGVAPADETKAQQAAALTNEYEMMRGDIVRVFYNASLAEKRRLDEQTGGKREGNLLYQLGTTIASMEQDQDGVNVTFSNHETKQYDLVVAADGQNSRTRQMAFGREASKASFQSIDIHAAYYEVPRLPTDDSNAHVYIGTGGRAVLTRTGNRDIMQVYLLLVNKDNDRHERIRDVHRKTLPEQKEAWTEIYCGAGWMCGRLLHGLQTTGDFYAHEIGQIKMSTHHAGRVVLLGDAGYCPSPFTGMGTTLSLIGSHILAGELAKHGKDVAGALKAYDELLLPALEKYQELDQVANTKIYPSSSWGIAIMNWGLWTMSVFRIDKLLLWASQFSPESERKYQLPLYPGLGLKPTTE